MRMVSLLAVAAVAGITFSNPVQASLQDKVMGEVTKAATAEVTAKKAEVVTEVTKTAVKSAAHSAGITGSDAMIDKAVDGYEKVKSVQALPEGSMTDIAKDTASKMVEGKDMTTAVTEAVDAKTETSAKAGLVDGLKKIGEEEKSKLVDSVKGIVKIDDIKPAAGSSDVVKTAIDTVTEKTETLTNDVVKTPVVKKEESSIWDSITGFFN